MIASGLYKPAFWCKNPHLQTLLPRIIFPGFKLEFIEERLELPDGDFVDLCWTSTPKNGEPVVAVFHGLEGSIKSPYANGIMHAIKKRGWCGVFMHFRGCSGVPNRLERSYHSGETGDIAFLIQTLNDRYSLSPVFTIGYSLGGNALLKYLGEIGKQTKITAAVAVSVPFLLNRGADRLNTGFSRVYQSYLIRSLQIRIVNKLKGRKTSIDLARLKTYNNFWLFDHHVTAPLHGFESADDYYTRCSSHQYLKSIQTPTLIIHARDDPFLPVDAIPAAADLSETIQLELSKHGGHVGFIEGNNPLQPEFWLERRIPEFITGFL